jgi:hypothetical protein
MEPKKYRKDAEGTTTIWRPREITYIVLFSIFGGNHWREDCETFLRDLTISYAIFLM